MFQTLKTNTSQGGEDDPFHVTPRIAFEQVKQVQDIFVDNIIANKDHKISDFDVRL